MFIINLQLKHTNWGNEKNQRGLNRITNIRNVKVC